MQPIKQVYTVQGAKMFNDTVDGKSYDSTTLYVLVPVDDTTGRSVGYATQELKFGTSAEYQKLKHLPFPLECELTLNMVTNGKTAKMIVTGFRPVQPTPATK